MPAAIDEIEAKLLAPDGETLQRIAVLRSIGRFDVEPTGSRHLTTTYLDTSDRRLLMNRVALRVRAAPAGREMTAKWGGSVDAEVHSRRELTVPLHDQALPTALPDGPLRDELGAIVGDRPLEILVVTAIERTTAAISDAGGVPIAELALDVVRHCGSSTGDWWPFYHEVEVEMASRGSPALVAEIASLLRAAWPLQPTSETKFSRALRDIHGVAFDPRSTRTEGE